MKLFIKKSDTYETVEINPNQDKIYLTHGTKKHEVSVTPLANGYFSVVIDHRSYIVKARQDKKEFLLNINHREAKVQVLDARQKLEAELFGASEGDERAGDVTAPMPGMILRVDVQPGDAVEAGQPILVMEAMKMENEIRASEPGKVLEVLVKSQQAVEKGDLLIKMG